MTNPTYASWSNMKDRCRNPNNISFKNYGGRGINYCVRWEKFANFLEDMGYRPEGLSLDRINNNGNYCKENCKWSTRQEQNNNKRTRLGVLDPQLAAKLKRMEVEKPVSSIKCLRDLFA